MVTFFWKINKNICLHYNIKDIVSLIIDTLKELRLYFVQFEG